MLLVCISNFKKYSNKLSTPPPNVHLSALYTGGYWLDILYAKFAHVRIRSNLHKEPSQFGGAIPYLASRRRGPYFTCEDFVAAYISFIRC